MTSDAYRTGSICTALSVLALVCSLFLLPGPTTAVAQTGDGARSGSGLSADELLQRAERALFPDNYFMRSSLTTYRPDRRDTRMVFESYRRRNAGSFIEVQEPARSRGMRFLEKDGDLWMFNPRANTRRAIRLSPRDSFQGSAFSNHDVSDPGYQDDYRVRIVGSETLDHQSLGSVQTTVLELSARREQAPYGRIVMWIRSDDHIPLLLEYYARSGLQFKRMSLDQLDHLGGRLRPRLMRMHSLEQEGFYSEIEIYELEQRDDLPDRLFSQANLTR